MSKLFVIRDDDLNYFTMPEDIEYWYKDAFMQGIPISFSAIPFVKGVSDVYTGGKSDPSREYPIGKNNELIEYVENHVSAIEIIQHGCTHETVNGVYEFGRNQGLFV